MKQTPLEPLILLRSFLTVVSGFIAAQFAYLMIGLALGYLFFPEFLSFFKLDDAAQKRLLAENIQAVVPWQMFVTHAFVSLIALYFIGWLSAALSPFGHFQHGLFIAILVFVWFMQNFVADPPSKKLMDAFLMVTQPVALLLGARQFSNALAFSETEFEESHE